MYAKVIYLEHGKNENYAIELTDDSLALPVMINLPGVAGSIEVLEYFQDIAEQINTKGEYDMGNYKFGLDYRFKKDEDGNEVFVETERCGSCGTEYFVGQEDFCMGCGCIVHCYNEDDPREDR